MSDVTVIGIHDVQRRLNRIRVRGAIEARKVVTKRAFRIQYELKRKLSTPGGGNRYRRGSKWHTASAPGAAPAPDTGRYRDSIALTFFRGGLAAEVGTNLTPYPGYLEPPPIGGDRGLSNRPAFAPVWEDQREAYIADMVTAVKMLGKG
jgi:hypothetical protein